MSYFKSVRLIDENGDAYGVKQLDNKPLISSVPWLYDVARGNVSGASSFFKLGANLDVGLTEEIIGLQGGTLLNLTAAETLQVKSSDVDDTGVVLSSGTATGGSATTLIDTGATFQTDTVAAGDAVVNDTDVSSGIVVSVDSEIQITVAEFHQGTDNAFEAGDTYRVVNANDTGAALVRISGVDGDYNVLAEYVVLNGTTNVTTTASFLRCNFMGLHLAGSAGSNEGNIDANNNADSSTLVRMGIGNGQSQAGYWTVPAGKTFYIAAGDASDESNKGTTIRMYVREYLHPFHLTYVLKLYTSSQQILFPAPFILPEKSDLEVRAQSLQAGGNVAIGIHGWYE